MLDVTEQTRLTMRYEAPESVLGAHAGGLLARTRYPNHSKGSQRWRGRCPGSINRSNPAMDADERRTVRAGDLADVRANTEEFAIHVGRFDRGPDLQGGKC